MDYLFLILGTLYIHVPIYSWHFISSNEVLELTLHTFKSLYCSSFIIILTMSSTFFENHINVIQELWKNSRAAVCYIYPSFSSFHCSFLLDNPRFLLISFPLHFKNFFSNSVKVVMLAANSPSFPSSENVLIFPSFLKDIFAVSKILV